MKCLNQKYFNSIGWIGGGVALTSYGLITQQIVDSRSFVFLSMNSFAYVSLMYYSFQKKAFANVALSSIYLLVTLFSIGRRLLLQ